MSKMYEKLQKCVSIIREKTDFVPEVALILGSGLGEYARSMDVRAFRSPPWQAMTAASFSAMWRRFRWSL